MFYIIYCWGCWGGKFGRIWIDWAVTLPSLLSFPLIVTCLPASRSATVPSVVLPILVESERNTILDPPSRNFIVTLLSSLLIISPFKNAPSPPFWPTAPFRRTPWVLPLPRNCWKAYWRCSAVIFCKSATEIFPELFFWPYFMPP